MTTINDQKYIERVLKGDKNAFANLVNKYKNMVFGLAFKMIKNREEAEEISQDSFIKAYKSLPKFKGESKFSTWLYKNNSQRKELPIWKLSSYQRYPLPLSMLNVFL